MSVRLCATNGEVRLVESNEPSKDRGLSSVSLSLALSEEDDDCAKVSFDICCSVSVSVDKSGCRSNNSYRKICDDESDDVSL